MLNQFCYPMDSVLAIGWGNWFHYDLCWIVLYLVDSIIHPLNNWAEIERRETVAIYFCSFVLLIFLGFLKLAKNPSHVIWDTVLSKEMAQGPLASMGKDKLFFLRETVRLFLNQKLHCDLCLRGKEGGKFSAPFAWGFNVNQKIKRKQETSSYL